MPVDKLDNFIYLIILLPFYTSFNTVTRVLYKPKWNKRDLGRSNDNVGLACHVCHTNLLQDNALNTYTKGSQMVCYLERYLHG